MIEDRFVIADLIKVVNNSNKNLMTLSNVGMILTATLEIPTPLIYLFITDFDSVFTAAPADPDTASPVLEDIANFKAVNFDVPHKSSAESSTSSGEVWVGGNETPSRDVIL